MRKIAVVTGGRADYGLLRNLMRAIRVDESLRLQALIRVIAATDEPDGQIT